jgi:hypothetical protein
MLGQNGGDVRSHIGGAQREKALFGLEVAELEDKGPPVEMEQKIPIIDIG